MYRNKLNNKVYVGQTNKPNRRFKEHLTGHSYYTSLIERAIKKYGIENFEFVILEWTKDYDERERYWIDFYRSFKPNGYNICEGGGYLPNQQGENHSQVLISAETAQAIQRDLMNHAIPQRQIVKKYGVTTSLVKNINSGHTWDYYSLEYPLRPTEWDLNKDRAKEVIRLLKETTLPMAEIGSLVGWGNSQVTMINKGENHRQNGEIYPIRPNPKDYSNKVDKCISLLQQRKSNGEIANLLSVSTGWVSRINNGKTRKKEKLSYPIRK